MEAWSISSDNSLPLQPKGGGEEKSRWSNCWGAKLGERAVHATCLRADAVTHRLTYRMAAFALQRRISVRSWACMTALGCATVADGALQAPSTSKRTCNEDQTDDSVRHALEWRTKLGPTGASAISLTNIQS
jgi:hypothetical protein